MMKLAITAISAVLAIVFLGTAGGMAFGESPAASQSAAATVKIREFGFHPGTLTVGRGTTVVFANRDSVTHTAKRAGSFATGRIKPGHSASVRFANSGAYPYHCTIHKFMHGKIVVR